MLREGEMMFKNWMKILPLFVIRWMCHRYKPETIHFGTIWYYRPFYGVLISVDKINK